MAEKIAGQAGKMHARDYYSKATYFRAYIPNMFPEYDKALYLDCDIALNGDISELYRFDIGESYVGGVTCEAVNTTPVFTEYAENYLGVRLPKYFNAGVMVLNLRVLRRINFEEKFFDILAKIKFEVAQDQDYFNVLCRGHVTFLPKAWNKIPRPDSKERLKDVRLVHYNLSFRPWRYDGVLYGELFWMHAEKTHVYDKLLEMKRGFTEKDAAYDVQWMENLKRMAYERASCADTFCRMLSSGKIVLME
jgi:lipopolysaccharide biosynthesis glycosyltransferase